MSKVIVGIISRRNTYNENEYLLISAVKDFGEYTGYYYPPGGRIEEGEDKETALKREIREELNLEVEPVQEIAETAGDIKDQITYWWQCNISGGELKIDASEIIDAKFFTREEMKNLSLWPTTKKFFEENIFI